MSKKLLLAFATMFSFTAAYAVPMVKYNISLITPEPYKVMHSSGPVSSVSPPVCQDRQCTYSFDYVKGTYWNQQLTLDIGKDESEYCHIQAQVRHEPKSRPKIFLLNSSYCTEGMSLKVLTGDYKDFAVLIAK